ncbi:MAG TPA: 1-acyl-sn-glycerol-3-phosphate acyltransferase [Burkholderiaceae bacterium]
MSQFILTPANVTTRAQRWAAYLFRLVGWRARLAPLPGPRGIVVVYPHTSNWDMPIGLIAKWVMGIKFRWLVKSSFFKGVAGVVLGPLFRYWGGVPIERQGQTGVIEKLAKRMVEGEPYWLVIAPEGTRSYRPHWRSGFYHLALTSKLPLGLAYIDYDTREVGLVDFLYLTGDVEADMARIRAAYDGRRALKPALAAPITLPVDKASTAQ